MQEVLILLIVLTKVNKKYVRQPLNFLNSHIIIAAVARASQEFYHFFVRFQVSQKSLLRLFVFWRLI
mgnify:CR=1 FL=1